MKKVPSFLEQLFDHENLEFRFDFNDEAIDVKASKNVMVNLKKAVQKILQDNSAILKEAYLKDLKKKFPFKIYVDMNSNRVLFDTQNNLAMYSKFMSKVF